MSGTPRFPSINVGGEGRDMDERDTFPWPPESVAPILNNHEAKHKARLNLKIREVTEQMYELWQVPSLRDTEKAEILKAIKTIKSMRRP